MSKADAFDAVMKSLRDARDEESGREAAKAVLLYIVVNRDHIARALRTLESAENPTDELALSLAQAMWSRVPQVDVASRTIQLLNGGKAALAAFREAVK